MKYTVKSVRYANPEHTAVDADTAEAGHVVLSAADTPREWSGLMQMLADGKLEIAAYARPPAPPEKSAAEKLDQLLSAAGLTLDEVRPLLTARELQT